MYISICKIELNSSESALQSRPMSYSNGSAELIGMPFISPIHWDTRYLVDSLGEPMSCTRVPCHILTGVLSSLGWPLSRQFIGTPAI